MRGSPRRRAPFDFILLAAALTLTVLGVIMVYSASAIPAEQTMGKPLYYLRRDRVFPAGRAFL
jgi:cell division protein FtsW (lipid II flippase)